MYTHHTQARLYHTDAAGILFYAKIYEITHDAYEEMMEKIGLPVNTIISDCDFILPFVHSEADYLSPIRGGDKLTVQVTAERIGSTAYTLLYTILKHDGTKSATVRTVSVSVDKKKFTKIPLPDKLRAGLEKINRGEL